MIRSISTTVILLASLRVCGPHNQEADVEADFIRLDKVLNLAYISKECPTPGLYSDSSKLVEGDIMLDRWGEPIAIYVGAAHPTPRPQTTTVDIIFLASGNDGGGFDGKDYTYMSILICLDGPSSETQL